MRARFRLWLVLVPVLALSTHSSATLRSGVETQSRRAHMAMASTQQHAGHTSGAGGGLSLAVNGSMEPDLIPDELAYSHFLRAMASSATAAGREAALTQAGLVPNDRAAFVAALGPLGADLAGITRQRQVGGPSLSHAALQQLKSREDEAVTAARQRLDLALTPVGLAQLDAHVRTHVKARIRIYRGPMPPSATGGSVQ